MPEEKSSIENAAAIFRRPVYISGRNIYGTCKYEIKRNNAKFPGNNEINDYFSHIKRIKE